MCFFSNVFLGQSLNKYFYQKNKIKIGSYLLKEINVKPIINIKAYPNPVIDDKLFIKIENFLSFNNIRYSLYDINGILIKEETLRFNNQYIYLKGLSNQMFVLKIQMDNIIITKKIIKK